MSFMQRGAWKHLGVVWATAGGATWEWLRLGCPSAVVEDVTGDLWGESVYHHYGCGDLWLWVEPKDGWLHEEVWEIEASCEAVSI